MKLSLLAILLVKTGLVFELLVAVVRAMETVWLKKNQDFSISYINFCSYIISISGV